MAGSDAITLVTVAFNAVDAGALMWESFNRFHEKPQLFVMDNGSKDGALEYWAERADLLLQGSNDHDHGQYLDRLCREVTTPYTLVVDTDVEFFGPQAVRLLEVMRWEHGVAAGCISGSGTHYVHEMRFEGVPRLEPCCVLYETEALQKALSAVSFGRYVQWEAGLYHDTGGMVARALAAAGGRIAAQPELEHARHYGGVSSLWCPDANEDVREGARRKYEAIQDRLVCFRGHGEAYSEALRALAAREQCANGLEIGLGYGASALAFLSATGSSRLITVEKTVSWGADQYIYDHGVKDRWRLILWASPEGVYHASNSGPFDWIYVDGDHAYESVKTDLDAVLPLLARGGVLVCDDYGLGKPGTEWHGVRRAVDEFREAQGWEMHRFGEKGLPYHPHGAVYFIRP